MYLFSYNYYVLLYCIFLVKCLKELRIINFYHFFSTQLYNNNKQ